MRNVTDPAVPRAPPGWYPCTRSQSSTARDRPEVLIGASSQEVACPGPGSHPAPCLRPQIGDRRAVLCLSTRALAWISLTAADRLAAMRGGGDWGTWRAAPFHATAAVYAARPSVDKPSSPTRGLLPPPPAALWPQSTPRGTNSPHPIHLSHGSTRVPLRPSAALLAAPRRGRLGSILTLV